MHKMSLEETQKCCLELLKEFDRICSERRYQYWLIGGSALGAIRHRGIIPWDDDIDVGMPRADYDDFCESFERHGRFDLLALGRSQGYFSPYAKLCDMTTNFEEPDSANCRHGVFLDVFPIDYIDADERAVRQALGKKRLYYLSFTANITAGDSRVEPFAKRIIKRLVKARYAGKDPIKLSRDITSIIACDGPTPRMMNIWGAWGERELVNSEWFGEGALMPFEDMTCPVPSQWDSYLTALYGDYMTPPKEPPHYHGHAYRISG